MPVQLFMQGVLNLWSLTYLWVIWHLFFPLLWALFNPHTILTAFTHSQPPVLPKQIKGDEEHSSSWILFHSTQGMVGFEEKKRGYFGWAQTYLVSLPQLIWWWLMAVKWDERHSWGCVRAIFDVEDLHLCCLLRPSQASALCAIFRVCVDLAAFCGF